MNPSSPPSAIAEEQAALWAARLDGSILSAHDRASLERWLAADPAHRVLLSSYCQFSADLEQQLPLLAGIRDGLAESPTVTSTTRPLPWLRRPILAGVALAAAVVVAVVLWQGRPQNHFQDLTAPVGGRQAATLPDGTRLELNAGSAATVELTRESRRVRLAGGEAFFHVAADPARPFYVETPAGSVRVTGTQFNVRAEAVGALEVTVLEGHVQVHPGGSGAARTLQAGDRLAASGGRVELRHLPGNELSDTLAWRTGHIVFNGTPLREALQRFARYHGRNLSVADEVAQERVGGRHRLDDLEGFLATLEEVLPVRVTRGAAGAIRVEAVPRP